MTLKDVLNEKAFVLGINATEKKEIVREISDFFAITYNLDKNLVFDALWTREQKGSTGLGKGLAIPHARLQGINTIKLAVFYSKEGRDFDSYDKKDTHLFFVAIIDEDGHPQEQLEILRMIVETCEKTDLMTVLQDAASTAKLKEMVLQRLVDTQNNE